MSGVLESFAEIEWEDCFSGAGEPFLPVVIGVTLRS